jgi:hypothetical protein
MRHPNGPFLPQGRGLGITNKFFILFPTRRIRLNILPNALQGALAANNMLIIVTLPNRCARGVALAIDQFADSGFI